MNERERFEGMALAKLGAIEGRMEELLGHVRRIEERCRREHAAQAALCVEVRALREKTNFNARVIWSAVAWITVAAAGALLAAVGMKGG